MIKFNSLEERRAYFRAKAKEHYEKIKKDPVKWAKYIEKRRVQQRKLYRKQTDELLAKEKSKSHDT